MYHTTDIEELLVNPVFFFNLILGFIVLIVFLRMAWNIGKIRKSILRDNFDLLLNEADKLIFKSKNEEAIDLYYDYIYYMQNSMREFTEKKRSIMNIVKKIKELGGIPPTNLSEEYMK